MRSLSINSLTFPSSLVRSRIFVPFITAHCSPIYCIYVTKPCDSSRRQKKKKKKKRVFPFKIVPSLCASSAGAACRAQLPLQRGHILYSLLQCVCEQDCSKVLPTTVYFCLQSSKLDITLSVTMFSNVNKTGSLPHN